MEHKFKSVIKLSNVSDGEVFTYPLILVKGRIIRCKDDCRTRPEVHVVGIDTKLSANIPCRLFNDKFLVLLHLETGINKFVFTFGPCSTKKTFFYHIPNKKEMVTPIYVICEDGVISDDESIDIRKKINLGAQLMQTLIAESLYNYGFNRKTFLLERDAAVENGNCLTFKSKLQSVDSTQMSAEELWEYFGRELLKSEYASKDRKFLAFYNTIPKNTSKLLAIGGGGLALCDINFIKTWPSQIEDVNQYLLDFASNEDLRSNYKERNFSDFVSSIGAVCHELCHTFDLGHTINGIMGKDFIRAGLMFVLTDNEVTFANINSTLNLRHDNNGNDSLIIADGDSCVRKLNINYSITCDRTNEFQGKNLNQLNDSYGIFSFQLMWNEGCASLLAYHRWINHEILDSDTINKSLENALQYDSTRGIVTSVYGIIVVQLRRSCGFVMKSWDFKTTNSKRLFLVPIYEARRASLIVIEDIHGNLLKQELDSAF